MFRHQGAIIREFISNNVWQALHLIQALFVLTSSNSCFGPTEFFLCVLKAVDSLMLLNVCKFYVSHSVHFITFHVFKKPTKYTIRNGENE